MMDVACHWGGLVSIPIAAQATSSHILHVIRNTMLTVLVIDETHLDFVLQLIEGTTVKHLVVINQQHKEYSKQAQYDGVTVTCLSSLESVGREHTIKRPNQVGKFNGTNRK
jgi:long-chain acyl-CoA synthetase